MARSRTNYVEAKDRAKLSVGDIIRMACDFNEISQAELSRRSSVSPSNLSDIIHGRRQVGKAVAEKLARALNVSPVFILYAGYEPREGADLENEITERVKTLRGQKKKIQSLIESSKHMSKGNTNLLRNLELINKINEEEDITGFYVLAKKALSDNKGYHKS